MDVEGLIDEPQTPWMMRATKLHEAGLEAIKAINTKLRKVFEVGEQIEQACENCMVGLEERTGFLRVRRAHSRLMRRASAVAAAGSLLMGALYFPGCEQAEVTPAKAANT